VNLNGVLIRDSFAEAFPMVATRVVVTADTPAWAMTAATSMTGFATSVIACGCEAAIETLLAPEATPDGRPGVTVLIFAMSEKDLIKQLQNRVGQCVLTCVGTSCFAGLDGPTRLPLGKALRYFADGFQISKKLGPTRYWRLPVMDGEFTIEDTTGMAKAIGGGNFLILAISRAAALQAAEAAVRAMREVPGIILPFPGGMVRSGSKIGSKYKGLMASTNDAYCPTLKGQSARSALPEEEEGVLEIVIDGLDEASIGRATTAGVRAACALGRKGGIVAIDAGNYGGKLGPYHFHLRKLLG
jgi:formylmethanofuran--tetrahydromethanopterin N-formyltransferase